MAWNNKLDPQIARRLLIFLSSRIAALDDPRSVGEALKGSKLGAYWKYRVADYRLICDISDDTVKIIAIKIGNRKDVYQ
jgi:mRNA interferase RelE/StbE